MKKLIILIIVFLRSGIWCQAQDRKVSTCTLYDSHGKDSLIYKYVEIGDSTWYYTDKGVLNCITFETDTLRKVWYLKDGKMRPFYRTEITVEKTMVLDGICHGITSTGLRCTRKTTKLFCWQHD